MKLSEIVKNIDYLKFLQREFFLATGQKTRQELFLELAKFPTDFAELSNDYETLDKKFLDSINQQLQFLKSTTEILHKNYLIDSQRHFGSIIESAEYIRNVRWRLSSQTETLIKNKIQSHSNWIFPACVFRPSALTDLRSIVSCDPLYLIDHNREILDQTVGQYPREYQNRLRPYVLDYQGGLDFLPQNNFGLVVAAYFFNFKDINTIERYLSGIFKLLRHGGICSFSFNDCNYSHEIDLAENRINSYVPGDRLKKIIMSLGYYTIFSYRDLTGISWWEIQKPGEISSLRGGQTLAKIIAKI
jgi:hypothetical protein